MAHRNDVVLSRKVRYGSTSRPLAGVDVLFTRSGYRHANRYWETVLRTMAVNYRLEIAEAYAIYETWIALGGSFDTFLARDWSDWHTAANNDMSLGGDAGTSHLDMPLMNPNLSPISNVGDGDTTVFHTYKRYGAGASAVNDERIYHPIDDANFNVGINAVDQGSGWTLTADGGLVTFSVAPSGSPTETLTWGGAHDFAVAFSESDLEMILEGPTAWATAPVLQQIRGV